MSEFIHRLLATFIGTFIGAYTGVKLAIWVAKREEKRKVKNFLAALDATMEKHGFERMLEDEIQD